MFSETINNPTQSMLDAIPEITKRYCIKIQKYWSESSQNPAVIVTGTGSEVIKAIDEIVNVHQSKIGRHI